MVMQNEALISALLIVIKKNYIHANKQLVNGEKM